MGAWVASHSFLSRRAARASFVLACVGLGCLTGWLAAPALIEQLRELSETLPRAAELASLLALRTALLTFIPNFGPVIAAVPPLLLALTTSPTKALLVGVLDVSVQTVESYLMTPLLERQTIALPPALTLSAQLALGVLFGGIGVIIATPLTLVALVTIKQLYVEDYLGDNPQG